MSEISNGYDAPRRFGGSNVTLLFDGELAASGS